MAKMGSAGTRSGLRISLLWPICCCCWTTVSDRLADRRLAASWLSSCANCSQVCAMSIRVARSMRCFVPGDKLRAISKHNRARSRYCSALVLMTPPVGLACVTNAPTRRSEVNSPKFHSLRVRARPTCPAFLLLNLQLRRSDPHRHLGLAVLHVRAPSQNSP